MGCLDPPQEAVGLPDDNIVQPATPAPTPFGNIKPPPLPTEILLLASPAAPVGCAGSDPVGAAKMETVMGSWSGRQLDMRGGFCRTLYFYHLNGLYALGCVSVIDYNEDGTQKIYSTLPPFMTSSNGIAIFAISTQVAESRRLGRKFRLRACDAAKSSASGGRAPTSTNRCVVAPCHKF